MINSNANKASNSAAYANYDANELLRQLRNAIATLRFTDIDKARLARLLMRRTGRCLRSLPWKDSSGSLAPLRDERLAWLVAQ